MFKSISISSFKSLDRTCIKLGDLTVLTGLNASGKSSVIQAIRMASEFINGRNFYLDGYGGYSELRSRLSSPDSSIVFDLEMDKPEDAKKTNIIINAYNSGVIKSCKNIPFNFEYISADRYGPKSNLPILNDSSPSITVGSRGEFVASYFQMFENSMVNPLIMHPSSNSETLEAQLNAWMSEISPQAKIIAKVDDKHDISNMEIGGNRASNTGFGISYSLPILLSTLAMTSVLPTGKRGEYLEPKIKKWIKTNLARPPILLIENPEAHIHPYGQTALAKFLCLASNCGVKIVVETHSDHFIDGIRISIKNGILPKENLSLSFFEQSELGLTIPTSIIIDENGRPNNWPRGFFDQSLINLRELSK